MKRLQLLPPGVRTVVFVFLVVGGFLLLVGSTLFLLTLTLNSTPRQVARSLVDGVTVAEFAALPDDDAYPSTVAIGTDGTVYTAGFASGVIWKISPDGATITEIPNTRDTFDSVSALAVLPDDSLLAVSFVGGEMGVWAVNEISPTGEIRRFATRTDDLGFNAPLDIALDGDGGVYVLDRTHADIWHWNTDGSGGTRWASLATNTSTAEGSSRPMPTGMTYDAATDAIYVTDTDANTVTQMPINGGAPLVVYRATDTRFPPGFDGIAVAPDGALYVTALDQKGITRIISGEMTYVAGNFRGPSDLVFTADGALIVTNFDSPSLAQPGIQPQLPFALDIIKFE